MRYLTSQGHSMKLQDMTAYDGQGFLSDLVNAYDGLSLSLSKKKEYRSSLRSFSGFLVTSGISYEDVFLELTVVQSDSANSPDDEKGETSEC